MILPREGASACCAQFFYGIKTLKSGEGWKMPAGNVAPGDPKAPVLSIPRALLRMRNGLLNNGHPLGKTKGLLFHPVRDQGKFPSTAMEITIRRKKPENHFENNFPIALSFNNRSRRIFFY